MTAVGQRPTRLVGVFLEGVRGIEGDVGGERRLSHRRAAGEDNQVGRVKTAELEVEVLQAGRNADDVTVAAERLFGAFDGALGRLAEVDDPAFEVAGAGKIVKPLLRRLDLLVGGHIHVGLVRLVHHILAERDELPAKVQVVDRLAVVGGVDDGDD